MTRHGKERSGELTFWLRSGFTGDGDTQGVGVESAKGEERESGFGEHDDNECREEERIITAPCLKFGR